jgi:hypothetical protein
VQQVRRVEPVRYTSGTTLQAMHCLTGVCRPTLIASALMAHVAAPHQGVSSTWETRLPCGDLSLPTSYQKCTRTCWAATHCFPIQHSGRLPGSTPPTLPTRPGLRIECIIHTYIPPHTTLLQLKYQAMPPMPRCPSHMSYATRRGSLQIPTPDCHLFPTSVPWQPTPCHHPSHTHITMSPKCWQGQGRPTGASYCTGHCPPTPSTSPVPTTHDPGNPHHTTHLPTQHSSALFRDLTGGPV